MRVVAGLYRHRKLEYPVDNENIRPTKDRIKEAFFSSVGDINGLIFLDLCAGSGGMGIEAISRGAEKSIFVDNNKISISFIKKNLNSLNIKNYEIKEIDVLKALEEIKNNEEKIDVVYFDPPYACDFYKDVIKYFLNNDILSEKGIFAIESNYNLDLKSISNLNIKEYHYGDIYVTVLRK